MTYNNLISQITDIITEQTISKKIPTVIFLSDISKEELIKNIICKLSGCDTDIFSDPSNTPWVKITEIMQTLTETPMFLKETSVLLRDQYKHMQEQNTI
ncbi:hypothetical protein IJI31_02520 [bacterium]|nr:hypothetical protein [bacterium]